MNGIALPAPWIYTILLVLGVLTASTSSVQASGLKTHLWIGQRILDELGQGCEFKISGKTVQVPSDVCTSIRSNPDQFLAGTLGPDVFPDLITGQVTTHPGIEGDWQTSEWLHRVYESAEPGAELAFAAGYLVHAASDVFAHTYVNGYAGDIFQLGDERAVELRHFVLEKYIDYHLPGPPVSASNLNVPAEFARDQLLYNADVSRLAGKSGTAPHIVAMNEVRGAVGDLANRLDRLEDDAGKALASVITESFEVQAKLANGEVALKVAEEAARVSEQALETEQKAYDEAYRAYRKAIEAYRKNQEEIAAAALQAKLAREGIEASRRALEELSATDQKLSQELIDLRQRILGVPSKVSRKFCDEVKKYCGPWGIFCGFQNHCWVDEVANPIYTDLNNKIHDAERKLVDLRSNVQKETVNIAANTAQEANELQRKAQLELETAALKIADAAATAAYKLNKARLEAQADATREAREEANRLRRHVADLREDLLDLESVREKLAKLVSGADILSWYAKNWRKGIDVAGREYIVTAMDVGRLVAFGDPGIMSAYGRWLTCYGSTFASVPYQFGEFGCTAEAAYRDFRKKLDDFIVDALPPPLDWLYEEYLEIKNEIIIELNRKIDDATIALAKLVSPDKTTDEFIEVLIRPENATRSKLNAVFSVNEDSDGKALLVFESVATLIDRDTGMKNGVLDPVKFSALRHSLAFSKMALLDDSGVRRLVWLMGADPSQVDIRKKGRRYSVLYQSLRSIDGNHQWQPYGLPYPRSDGKPQPDRAAERNFGYGPADGDGMGLPLFIDEGLRKFVFLRVFEGDITGALGEHPMLAADRYPFPGCAGYYPVTFDATGQPVKDDRTCTGPVNRHSERARIREFWRSVLNLFGYQPRPLPKGGKNRE